MSKNIIFCADGTWDKPKNKTNVHKLFDAVNSMSNPSVQVAFYDDGVGSDGTPFEKLAGGAVGEGLFQKIKDGYKKIMRAYERGDDIFIFGFSRGAYIARSLAGMIAVCGLPTAPVDDEAKLVNTAFQAYRNQDQRPALLASLNQYALDDAKIKMVGVWDTVGALGIPALFGGVDLLHYGFLDTSLHPDVLHAYQALAIDERRKQFPPTLWTPPSPPVAGQVLEQVWFCGVHCDVGGGYPETGLSDITFSWMLGKVKKLGLHIAGKVWAQYASLDANSALAQIHKSWNIFWLFPKSRTIASDAALSNSVAIRCKNDPSYQPGNLILSNGAPDGSYQPVQVVSPAQD
jgi:uncharacterized protein (DUF2235 family)